MVYDRKTVRPRQSQDWTHAPQRVAIVEEHAVGSIGDDHNVGSMLFLDRHRIGRFLEQPRVETAIGSLVCWNALFMILETNYKADCVTANMANSCAESWHDYVNSAFCIFYSAELALRIYVYWPYFFSNSWHIMDFIVVVLSVVEWITWMASQGENLQVILFLRLARLLRLFRLCSFFPDLYEMVRGFIGAARAMFWGLVMICVLLLIFAIFTVEVIHPLNQDVLHTDEWCYTAFSSVEMCMLLFFQTMFAGDNWGECSLPIMRSAVFSVFIFGGVLVTIQLGFMNFILAVILDRARDSREADLTMRAEEFKKERQASYDHILRVIRSLDEDASGEISLEEVEVGIKECKELQTLLGYLSIEPELLKHVFRLVMDEDRLVKVETLVETLQKAETSDVNMQVLVVDLTLEKVRRSLEKTMPGSFGSEQTGTRASRPEHRARASSWRSQASSCRNTLDVPSQPSLCADIIDSVFSDLRININKQLDDELCNLFTKVGALMPSVQELQQIQAHGGDGAKISLSKWQAPSDQQTGRNSSTKADSATPPGHEDEGLLAQQVIEEEQASAKIEDKGSESVSKPSQPKPKGQKADQAKSNPVRKGRPR